jgi:hypothetical protein
VPDAESVEYVCLTTSLYEYDLYEQALGSEQAARSDPAGDDVIRAYQSARESRNVSVSAFNQFFSVSREPGGISGAMTLHRQILSDKPTIQEMPPVGSDPGYYDYSRSCYIIYQMTDGSRRIRSYQINPADYSSYIAPLYESPEYKRINFPIMTQSPEDIALARFAHYRRTYDEIHVPPDQIPALTQALQTDIQNISFRDAWTTDSGYAVLSLYESGRNIQETGSDALFHTQYTIHPAFRTTRRWLEDHGYPISPPTSAQIKEIRVESVNDGGDPAAAMPGFPPESVTVTDPDIIDAILLDDSYSDRSYSGNPFDGRNDPAVNLFFIGRDANTGGELVFEGFYDRKQTLPPALQDYLETTY